MQPPIVKGFLFQNMWLESQSSTKLHSNSVTILTKKEKKGKSKPTIVVHSNGKGMEKKSLG